MAVGDFNGDGKADLAVANTGDSVSVLLGNGDGTFQAAVNYGAGRSSQSVAVGDFNGDGKADLAVANISAQRERAAGQWRRDLPGGGELRGGQRSVRWRSGTSTGTAKPTWPWPTTSDNVSVLLGNGDGTFQAAVELRGGYDPYSVAVGDFNGDGKADLAVANCEQQRECAAGQRRRDLPGGGELRGGYVASSVAVGDFNGDGKADLAVANGAPNSDNVSVLLGNGNGTFQAAVTTRRALTLFRGGRGFQRRWQGRSGRGQLRGR